MFNILQTRLSDIFESIKRRGSLSERNLEEALRDVHSALLEADVALPVARALLETIKARSIGAKVTKSITPGQQVIKIVHDGLTDILSGDDTLNLKGDPPIVIMLVGLQGAGKTTTVAKISLLLTKKKRRKVLMVSLDTRRPAAREQLAILGEQVSIDTIAIDATETDPLAIAKNALEKATLGGYDVMMLDTAGRLSIDENLMTELSEIKSACHPQEILLVADSMTGQDSVTTAKNFHEKLGLTGIILTRIDGDSRGGAALSMRFVTGCPIKYLGVGEKVEDLETFDAKRIAGRILGMGDVVALVEKAQEVTSRKEQARMEKRMARGNFDLNDLKMQLQKVHKMGGISNIMKLLPGMGKMKAHLSKTPVADDAIVRQSAIIDSMTKKERATPKILHASRKRRVARGSGTSVNDVNKLLKQFQMMTKMLKKMGKIEGGNPDALSSLESNMENTFRGRKDFPFL